MTAAPSAGSYRTVGQGDRMPRQSLHPLTLQRNTPFLPVGLRDAGGWGSQPG